MSTFQINNGRQARNETEIRRSLRIVKIQEFPIATKQITLRHHKITSRILPCNGWTPFLTVLKWWSLQNKNIHVFASGSCVHIMDLLQQPLSGIMIWANRINKMTAKNRLEHRNEFTCPKPWDLAAMKAHIRCTHATSQSNAHANARAIMMYTSNSTRTREHARIHQEVQKRRG